MAAMTMISTMLTSMMTRQFLTTKSFARMRKDVGWDFVFLAVESEAGGCCE